MEFTGKACTTWKEYGYGYDTQMNMEFAFGCMHTLGVAHSSRYCVSHLNVYEDVALHGDITMCRYSDLNRGVQVPNLHVAR
jgi:hypothetical protein